MKMKEQKKREVAEKLATALRAHNAIEEPPRWRGCEEILAVYSALAYSDGSIDFALQQLMNVAEMAQEGNRYTLEVHRVLKQAQVLFLHHHFTYYRMNIIFELSRVKRIFW